MVFIKAAVMSWNMLSSFAIKNHLKDTFLDEVVIAEQNFPVIPTF